MNKSTVEKQEMKIKGPIYMTRIMIFTVIFVVLSLGSDVYAGDKLKAGIPDLCYKCHKKLKENLKDRYAHFLFKQGKCTACHNSHVSNVKGLMIGKVNSVCLNCHESLRKLLDRAKIHSVLRDGTCMDCHNPHSGSNKSLLVTDEKKLCLDCHEDIKGQLEKPYGCLPFKEGNCSSCHNSHASVEGNMLIDAPNRLCQKCHAPRCKAGEVSISSIVKDSDCTTCHSGHASDDKGLLGPYGHTVFLKKGCKECHDQIKAGEKVTTRIKGRDLCFSCHKQGDSKYKFIESDIHVKGVENPCNICHDHHASGKKTLTKNESRICLECHQTIEKKIASMEKAFTFKCAPVKERRCFDCHIPMHFDRPLNHRADGIEMCARCHAVQHKITHPLGNNVIDPRDGKALTCLSCHSMHSAKGEFLLSFDRNRALCIQCHKI